MSEQRWIKRAKLLMLSVAGISAVSIPVTAALVLPAAAAESPPALGAPADPRPARENPAKATEFNVIAVSPRNDSGVAVGY